MKGVDSLKACRSFLGSGALEAGAEARLAAICDEIQTAREGKRRIVRSGCKGGMSGTEWQRIVNPMRGATAEAWEDAPFERNGGTRHELAAGAEVELSVGPPFLAAHYHGEVWLNVAGYDGNVWIRESDLRRLTREEMLAVE